MKPRVISIDNAEFYEKNPKTKQQLKAENGEQSKIYTVKETENCNEVELENSLLSFNSDNDDDDDDYDDEIEN